SDFYVNIVGSGETIGKLDKVLHYLADQQEKDYDLMSKIKGAMIYPIFVLMAMAGIGVVMMIFVIPKLTDVLKETGGDLPMATKILMGASDFMIHYWWLLLGGVIVLAVTVRVFLKTPAGKKFFDYFLLKLPIFGKLFQRIYLIRFTRSLATLVVGGVALTKGLKITAGIVGNTVYRDLITRTIKEVEEGNSISTVFMESKEMPQMVSQMLIVGEKTGRID
ncbi:MAG: secretion system protein, partial [Parcubacteria group bacterium CG_4_10_14_0_8_um_filter_35_7]